MSTATAEPVQLAHPATSASGSRCGTVKATRAQLEEIFGESHIKPTDFFDEKVTFGWKFITPRGPVEVRDYWWNAKNEMSIGAQSHKAALWIARYMRRLGFKADARSTRLNPKW